MRFDVNDAKYKKEVTQEAKIWGDAAEKDLKQFPPDYSSYKNNLAYKIYRNVFLQRMLSNIKPGQKVLDLGCYNGWFSLELARRGAIVDAHDVAGNAIAIAQKYYKKMKAKEKFTGEIRYHITDLNDPHFPKNTYDLVVFRNILHHIGNVEELVLAANKALKPKGKILADDGLPCGKKEALIIGGFLMLFPTAIPYNQKLQKVFRKGKILERTQGLADSKDGSPFEGITGEESVEVLKRYFTITYYATFAAFIGVLVPQLRLSDTAKTPFLKLFNKLDRVLTRTNVLQGSIYYLEAVKK